MFSTLSEHLAKINPSVEGEREHEIDGWING